LAAASSPVHAELAQVLGELQLTDVALINPFEA
jgi:hypothetical protein